MNMTRRWLAIAAIGLLLLGSTALADPVEPTPNPEWRQPRADYVRTWYIYNDANLNGILDPGDQRIDIFQNWWTPVSAHTQHNYEIGPYGPNQMSFPPGDDLPSAPMNFASETDPSLNYWLPRDKNTMNFYMTYSQFDNNDWATFTGQAATVGGKIVEKQRNLERNGYAMGWVTHDVTKDANGNLVNDQTPAGSVKMDVYVHNGAGTYQVSQDIDGGVFGTSRSNPQISMSNDIDYRALDHSDSDNPLLKPGKQWHPPDFDEATQSYSWARNQFRMERPANGYSQVDFDQIVASMEQKEVDPMGIGPAEVVWGNRTPTEIYNNLVDDQGNPYEYQDAFREDSVYVEGSTDGGVIAGLSGYDEYDPEINNWGQQQVIRIDIDPRTLSTGEGGGNITKVAFWDFGEINSDQLHPREIILDLTNLELFPEGRFYIARVIPEPTTLLLLVGGGAGLLLGRRKRRTTA